MSATGFGWPAWAVARSAAGWSNWAGAGAVAAAATWAAPESACARRAAESALGLASDGDVGGGTFILVRLARISVEIAWTICARDLR